MLRSAANSLRISLISLLYAIVYGNRNICKCHSVCMCACSRKCTNILCFSTNETVVFPAYSKLNSKFYLENGLSSRSMLFRLFQAHNCRNRNKSDSVCVHLAYNIQGFSCFYSSHVNCFTSHFISCTRKSDRKITRNEEKLLPKYTNSHKDLNVFTRHAFCLFHSLTSLVCVATNFEVFFSLK